MTQIGQKTPFYKRKVVVVVVVVVVFFFFLSFGLNYEIWPRFSNPCDSTTVV